MIKSEKTATGSFYANYGVRTNYTPLATRIFSIYNRLNENISANMTIQACQKYLPLKSESMTMRLKLLTILALALLCFASCTSSKKDDKKDYSENRSKMESTAQSMLQDARKQIHAQQYEKAKSTIKQMRKQCYLAIEARSQGILLMDSIELLIAQRELAVTDSLLRIGKEDIDQSDFEEACRKVEFYERKILFDNKK